MDNLLAIDLVTAEGEQLRVDAETEPDLYWGLRGGGGNFGIATSFELRLHPVGPMVLGGPMFWPLADAPEVLRFVRDYAPAAPDELGITLGIAPAPPISFTPPDHFGKPVAGVVLVWAGDPAAGEQAIAPFRRIATPIADGVRPVPYVALQSLLDGGAPHGRHYYWKAHRLPTLPDEAIDVLVERMGSPTSPFSQINGWAIGGAVSRVGAEETAVGDRELGFEINITAAWTGADPEPERHVAWVREGWESLRPHASGVYANFLSDEGNEGLHAAFGERLGHLRALKDRYDSSNVFRLNANIPPTQ